MLISSSCITILLATSPLIARADQTTEARTLASQMIQQPGAALTKELAANGPDGAVLVCRDIAPAIAGELSRKPGGRVARVSVKIRNPSMPARCMTASRANFSHRLKIRGGVPDMPAKAGA